MNGAELTDILSNIGSTITGTDGIGRRFQQRTCQDPQHFPGDGEAVMAVLKAVGQVQESYDILIAFHSGCAEYLTVALPSLGPREPRFSVRNTAIGLDVNRRLFSAWCTW